MAAIGLTARATDCGRDLRVDARRAAHAGGGFASSLDADSEGEEGKFYVWTPDEVGPRAADIFSVTARGTFEHGRSVLQLLTDPADDVAYAEERARLLEIRAGRVRPGRDDKVVAAWNGLAIAALAECGALFRRDDFAAAARDARISCWSTRRR